MEIERCFEILELDRSASLEEAKQAYKDLVNVWHPDRFSNNPRLREKAEEKLKEANLAYESVKSFICLKQQKESEQGKSRQTQAKAKTEAEAGEKEEAEAAYCEARTEAEEQDRTEAFFEAGTRTVLTLWSYLSKALRRIVVDAKAEIEQGEFDERYGGGDTRGRRRGEGRGMGRGKGGGRGRG